jgi:chorismate dehydratase
LLKERYGIVPETRPLPIGEEAESVATDAVLFIGDRAIQRPLGDFVVAWDLGDEWCRWSELPFVFAMWVARSGVDASDLAVALEAARDAGVANLSEIAQHEAASVGLSVGECLSYLRDNLYFYLGPREMRGLELFRRHASRLGLIPAVQRA